MALFELDSIERCLVQATRVYYHKLYQQSRSIDVGIYIFFSYIVCNGTELLLFYQAYFSLSLPHVMFLK